METISVESTLGTTSSFSLIVSVIVTGSGKTISSSSKIPKIYRKERTIMLVIIEVPKTMFTEDLFFWLLSSTKSEIYFFCSNNSCCSKFSSFILYILNDIQM